MKVAVACGGTGGHIFPGLATARRLRARGHAVTLWLGGRDVESASAVDWDGPVVRVAAAGFAARPSVAWARTVWQLAAACRACRRRMRSDRPDALLAMGSYASVGPVLAARSLRVPVVLHESNAVPGRALQTLSRFAHTVAVAFDAAQAAFPGRRVVVTGFPVRADLDGVFGPDVLRPDRFTLLVMGGSQGAQRLNKVATAAVCGLHARGVPIQTVHLAGARDEAAARAAYARAGVPALVFGFLREMGKAYRAASLAVARSGAASCAELAAFGVPALLVPLPEARRDHQAANARALRAAGGADWVRQGELTAEWLTAYIERAIREPARLDAMRAAMKTIDLPDREGRLAELVEQVGRRNDADL